MTLADRPVYLAPASATLSTKDAAYLGDAVYELLVRQWVLCQWPDNPDRCHTETTRLVCAEAQALLLQWLLDATDTPLNEEELALLKRGRNLPIPKARQKQQQSYRKATALEVLVGYWFTNTPQKLPTLLGYLPQLHEHQHKP